MGLFDDGASLALGSALDSVSHRQRMTAQNIANVMTPGYRAQRVHFEDSLASAVQSGDPTSARRQRDRHRRAGPRGRQQRRARGGVGDPDALRACSTRR